MSRKKRKTTCLSIFAAKGIQDPNQLKMKLQEQSSTRNLQLPNEVSNLIRSGDTQSISEEKMQELGNKLQKREQMKITSPKNNNNFLKNLVRLYKDHKYQEADGFYIVLQG